MKNNLESGKIYSVSSVDGNFADGEDVLVTISEPPMTVESRIEHVERGFVGVAIARVALKLTDEIPAKLNVSDKAPHNGSLSIYRS